VDRTERARARRGVAGFRGVIGLPLDRIEWLAFRSWGGRGRSAADVTRRAGSAGDGIPSSGATIAVLAVSVFAVSLSAPLIRFTDVPALLVSFWRLAITLLLIAVILTTRGEWSALAALTRRELGVAALAGVFLAAHFATWIASVHLTTVAASAALVATQPVWVALFATVTLRESPSRRQWVGIAIAVLGAAVIGGGDLTCGPGTLQGHALALAGAVFVAAYYVMGRGLRRRVGLWPCVAAVYGFAALTLLVAAVAGGLPLAGPFRPTDWLVFIALAVGPMLIGHTGQNWALRYLPAYVVSLALLGEPVGATLIAWSLPAIREVPAASTLAGAAMVLAGIMLGFRRDRNE
jgi:drug/metabolite transporter (DMT)-like permease